MRIIYIIHQKIENFGNYPGRWYNPNTWYNLGLILSYVLQFLVGFGIATFLKALWCAIF